MPSSAQQIICKFSERFTFYSPSFLTFSSSLLAAPCPTLRRIAQRMQHGLGMRTRRPLLQLMATSPMRHCSSLMRQDSETLRLTRSNSNGWALRQTQARSAAPTLRLSPTLIGLGIRPPTSTTPTRRTIFQRSSTVQQRLIPALRRPSSLVYKRVLRPPTAASGLTRQSRQRVRKAAVHFPYPLPLLQQVLYPLLLSPVLLSRPWLSRSEDIGHIS